MDKPLGFRPEHLLVPPELERQLRRRWDFAEGPFGPELLSPLVIEQLEAKTRRRRALMLWRPRTKTERRNGC